MDREHTPIVIEEFKGLFQRGAPRNTPPNYATKCENIKLVEDGIQPRSGVEPYQNVVNPLGNILRQYDYFLPAGSSYLTLVEGGQIYHITSPTSAVLILTIAGMTDFGYVQNGNNAFISPAYTDPQGRETGMPGQVIYVYKGDGIAARPAGGAAPVNGGTAMFYVTNKQIAGIPGKVTAGVHIVLISINNGGGLENPGPEYLPIVIAPGNEQIQAINIPTPAGAVSRALIMTKAIDPAVWIQNPTNTYPLFVAVTIADNTTKNLLIDISDDELITPFAPIGGVGPVTNSFQARQSATNGHCDPGFRIISVIYETNTGAFTKPGPEFYATATTVDPAKAIDILNIPISPNSYVIRRHLIATKVIRLYNGDQNGFQFFFIPSGTINDNTTTNVTISWFDSELLEDASYLLYNNATIPAGVVLSKYKNRMVSIAEAANIALARLSVVGDFESFSSLDGFIQVPPNNRPLSNAHEFRDVLYIFQDTKTIQYVDNDQEPATWKDTILDNGVGTGNHGIATVLDSGGVNVDFLLIGHYSGIFIFNGAYSRPELTFAINDLWVRQSRDDFFRVQIINDSVNQILYCVTTDGNLLVGNYSQGLTPSEIRWSIWTFDFLLRTIHLTNIDQLVLGAFSLSPSAVL